MFLKTRIYDLCLQFAKIEKWSALPDLKSLQAWSKKRTKNSDLFFQAPKIKVHLKNGLLKFDSPISSVYPKNNKAHAQYFKSKKNCIACLGRC